MRSSENQSNGSRSPSALACSQDDLTSELPRGGFISIYASDVCHVVICADQRWESVRSAGSQSRFQVRWNSPDDATQKKKKTTTDMISFSLSHTRARTPYSTPLGRPGSFSSARVSRCIFERQCLPLVASRGTEGRQPRSCA